MAFRGDGINTKRGDNNGINTARLGKAVGQPMAETYEEKMARLDREARLEQIEKEEAAEERAKKNQDFVQFTKSGLNALAKLKSAFAVQVFLWLTKEMGNDNALIVSQDTIAEALGVSRQTTNKAISDLEAAQILLVIKAGTSIVYHLNSNFVWQSWATNKKYAKFSAQIIISEKEYQLSLERRLVKRVSKKQGKLELE